MMAVMWGGGRRRHGAPRMGRRPGHAASMAPLCLLVAMVTACAGVSGDGGSSRSDAVRLVSAASAAVVLIEGDADAVGSGFVLAGSGLILTTGHGIAGRRSLAVTLTGQPPIAAQVLHVDHELDVAVLIAPGMSGVEGLRLSAGRTEPGKAVVALGNPFGLGITATAGIVSAVPGTLGRQERLAGLLQTDAAINPGNSGGPLIDASGQVVGMVTAALALGQGVGFAVPADVLREVLCREAPESMGPSCR